MGLRDCATAFNRSFARAERSVYRSHSAHARESNGAGPYHLYEIYDLCRRR